MFQEIRKKVTGKTNIVFVIALLFAVLEIAFGVGYFFQMNRDFEVLIGTLVLGGVLLGAALSYRGMRVSRFRKLLAALGVSDVKAQEALPENALALDRKTPQMIWVTEDRVINFDSLKTYGIRSIRNMRPLTYPSEQSDDSYGIVLYLNGEESKDEMVFPSSSERDEAMSLLSQLIKRYGGGV